MSGFYTMHRGWQEHPVFGREEFSRRDAWVWLIEHAAYRPRRIGAGTKAIELRRGQLCHSLRHLAAQWGWDDPKVRRFLSRIASEGMIECVVVNGQTVITVCNYDEYQHGESVADAEPDAPTTHQRRTNDANKKEGNKGNKREPIGSLARKPLALDEEMREWAALEAPHVSDLEGQLAAHSDWKRSKGRRYRDDRAGFRNWLRKAEKEALKALAAQHRPSRFTPGEVIAQPITDDQRQAHRMKMWHEKGIWLEGWGVRPSSRDAA